MSVLTGGIWVMQFLAEIVYPGICVAVFYSLVNTSHEDWSLVVKFFAAVLSLVIALVRPIPAVGTYVVEII